MNLIPCEICLVRSKCINDPSLFISHNKKVLVIYRIKQKCDLYNNWYNKEILHNSEETLIAITCNIFNCKQFGNFIWTQELKIANMKFKNNYNSYKSKTIKYES